MEVKMIELSFWDFHEGKYDEEGYSLYVMKNGFGGILYIGISQLDIWSRWFSRGGHITWDGNVIYGESSVGVKIERNLPDSLSWKIQLWTLNDCIKFCGDDIPSHNIRTIQAIEPIMIKKLSPILNSRYNYNPGKDTTPKSEKEKAWEKYVDQSYDEIFNKKE
jgi:hypothetical protein